MFRDIIAPPRQSSGTKSVCLTLRLTCVLEGIQACNHPLACVYTITSYLERIRASLLYVDLMFCGFLFSTHPTHPFPAFSAPTPPPPSHTHTHTHKLPCHVYPHERGSGEQVVLKGGIRKWETRKWNANPVCIERA